MKDDDIKIKTGLLPIETGVTKASIAVLTIIHKVVIQAAYR